MDAAVDGPPDGSIDGSPDAAAEAADAPSDALPDGPMLVTTSCNNAGLLAGCQAGACTVSATGSPLPDGVSITVTRKPVPSELNGDTLGSVLCSIALPAGIASLPNLHLSIAQAAPPDANAVLFQHVSPVLSRLVVTSQPLGNAVDGLVTAPGDFGATERPGIWSLETDVGLNVTSSGDLASLLQNLSAQLTSGAFYDGTRLFACNGTRLVVYDGIPSGPSIKPSVVLGQPSLDTATTQVTSSLFGAAGCSGLWSDGTRLVVASGNRILIWNTIPTADAAPADLVLGQTDFSSNTANAGGISATSLGGVVSVDSDGTRLLATETRNNRVLVWNTFPTSVDQPADFVLGQPDFATGAPYSGATQIYQAWGGLFVPSGVFVSGQFGPGLVHTPPITANNAAADFMALPRGFKLVPTSIYTAGRVARTPSGGLAVRDANQQRIAMLRSLPTAMGPMDFVLGQPDPEHVVTSPISASVVATQVTEEGLGGGAVFLAPDANRLLVFDTPPTFNFEPASRVIGQAGFTTNGLVDYRAISSATLAGPADVAVGTNVVAVADRGNNRVVLYRTSDIAAHTMSAAVVLGQADAASYIPNLDQRTPSAARLSGPSGVAFGGPRLIVADTENHRVVIWNTVPTTTGTPADLVLGQSDFVGRRPNRGRGDADGDGFSDAAGDGFFYPTGVASDGVHLFVADRLNNRILVWNTFPTAMGQAADRVIGQADLLSSQPNRGMGPFAAVADGLNLPTGVTLAGTTLWVADTENNRVVRWDLATSAPAPGAFVGQASGTAVANPNYQQPADVDTGFAQISLASTDVVLRPRSALVAGGRLYVSESDGNRVHVFDATTLASQGVLGQASDTVSTPNATGVDATTLSTPLGLGSDGATLWVADSNNHRVVGFDLATAPSTGAAASALLGQPAFFTNGFNQASTAANGVTGQPSGVALGGGNLYIADTGNSRVLVLKTPVSAGQAPARVYGQSDMLRSLANAGGAPSASTLSTPHGVFVDTTHLLVADTGNNRVLVYDPNATTSAATLVLGQPNFTSNGSNVGGASAATMQGPSGIFSDGTSLWVADTGNHRVLFWRTFPTANGQRADLVIGQPSFSATLPNQGGPASAASLSFPASVDVVNGVLYIADGGNNRVVSFSMPPTSPGASADGVLGQANLVSRGAATTGSDLTLLAGPVALADDGQNLYVTDRDLGRIVVYSGGTITTGAVPVSLIGTVGGLVLRAPAGLAVERTAFFTSRLYVADTGNNQVAVIQSVSRLPLE